MAKGWSDEVSFGDLPASRQAAKNKRKDRKQKKQAMPLVSFVMSAGNSVLTASTATTSSLALVVVATTALALLVGQQTLQHSWYKLLHLVMAEQPQLFYNETAENKKLLSRCPSLVHEKYIPLWYLVNGHLQTLHVFSMNRSKNPTVEYQRERVDLPDGGVVALDWALPVDETTGKPMTPDQVDTSRPTMLVLPGLAGGSREYYVRSMVRKMVALNWQVVVLNSRGCSRTELKTPKLFSCGFTDDVRYVAQLLADKHRFGKDNHSFVAAGFSMGSNVLVKYLGEEKESTPLTAAISVGNPFNLESSCKHLTNTRFKRKLYDESLAANLRRLFFKTTNGVEMFKDLPQYDLDALRKSRTLYEFDHHFTRIHWNYDTADDYYRDASSGKMIKNVSIPLLCLNAKDDPICDPHSLPYEEIRANDKVILATTSRGGHLAFYQTPKPPTAQSRKEAKAIERIWSVTVASEFAQSAALLKANT